MLYLFPINLQTQFGKFSYNESSLANLREITTNQYSTK